MSEQQPNDIKEGGRQDFDDESDLGTVHDPRALGERALEVALQKLGPRKVAEAAARAAESDAKPCRATSITNHYYFGKQSYCV